MDTPGTDATAKEHPGSGVSRRALVRTGVWAVPAVTVATAAPALAASGQSLAVSAYSVSVIGLLDRRLRVTLTIQNLATVATSAALQATFTLDKGTNRLSAAPSRLFNSSGWGGSGPAGSGPWTYVYTRTAALSGAASTTLTFQLLLTVASTQPSTPVTASVVATSTGFASGAGSTTVS